MATFYTRGKVFGRSLLKSISVNDIPAEFKEALYVRASSLANLPEVSDINADFVRGVVEPSLCFKNNTLSFFIVRKVVPVVDRWLEERTIKFVHSEDSTDRMQGYELVGPEVLDFLSSIYDTSNAQTRDAKIYERYLLLANACPMASGCVTNPKVDYSLPTFRVVRVDERAILPSKKRASDVGYDLTLIAKVKTFNSRTALYDTGLIIQPPAGYYIEVVPRSSLSKSNYIQGNSIGIIDPNYLDTIKIPLTYLGHVDEEQIMPVLPLPFTGFQFIIRRPYHGLVVECTRQDLAQTSRDTGGFGSTGGLSSADPKLPL
jgi:dUTP pyrophosphatase